MNESHEGGQVSANFVVRGLTSWVATVVRHPVATLLLVAALTAASLFHSSRTVRMNSDVSTLLSQEEPFRQDYNDYVAAFPQLADTTLIVVTSDSLDQANDAIVRLRDALAKRTDLIATVYAPGSEEFFRDHALLYLDPEALNRVIEGLAEAQPALAALAVDESLRGLFGQLEVALDNVEDGEAAPGLVRLADLVSGAAESLLAGKPRKIAWADEFVRNDSEIYRLLIVQGQTDFDERIPTRRLIEGIRQVVDELGLTPDSGVRVRLTGTVPLLHDEQVALQQGLTLAVLISVILLTVLLYFGVRSFPIIAGTLASILVSLTWTTSFAMIAVGEFNVISAAFAVLLIGLGDDFALHVGLRCEDESRHGTPVRTTLVRAAAGVGGAISLCALTSAIGFLSYVPTRYDALADLGIISAGGMFISLIVSFTVFPAVLTLLPSWSSRGGETNVTSSLIDQLPMRHPGAIIAVSAVLTVAAIAASTQVRFDFSNLSMRDPESESMTTLRDVQAQGFATDYAAIVLAPDLASSVDLGARLAALPQVASVETPFDHVPADQAAKLELIDDAAFFLEPALYPTFEKTRPDASERLAALTTLKDRIAALSPQRGDTVAQQAIRRLGQALEGVTGGADPESRAGELESLVISDLGARMAWLREALEVGPIDFADLPEGVRTRLVAADGRARIAVVPRGDMSDVEELRSFAAAVATIAPHATGRPAVEMGIGGLVVDSFQLAIVLALSMVTVLLLVVLRDVGDALMLLIPITMAALFTTAIGVLIGMPFNMSNVVVIPLVLGLGVDTGIHLVLRFRESGSMAEMVASSTPRAAVLSALTTLAAYSSLSVSGHLGLRSLGVLLSIAMVCLMFTSLIVLPAVIVARQRWMGRGRKGRTWVAGTRRDAA